MFFMFEANSCLMNNLQLTLHHSGKNDISRVISCFRDQGKEEKIKQTTNRFHIFVSFGGLIRLFT